MKSAPSLARLPASSIPSTYAELVRFYPPRPLHDKIDLHGAMEIADWLTGAELNQDQSDYLQAVGTFIEKYEAEHVVPVHVTGLQALEFLLENNELSRKNLAALLKVHPSVITRIFTGQRQWKPAELKVLSERFGVSADLFLATA
jgi:antitoxin component HigA of HigAB toxin-antitoxin module